MGEQRMLAVALKGASQETHSAYGHARRRPGALPRPNLAQCIKAPLLHARCILSRQRLLRLVFQIASLTAYRLRLGDIYHSCLAWRVIPSQEFGLIRVMALVKTQIQSDHRT